LSGLGIVRKNRLMLTSHL